MSAVSNFRWVGVFSFTAAAAIIGTFTCLDTAGAPAFFPT
jgi:hypothetical protein